MKKSTIILFSAFLVLAVFTKCSKDQTEFTIDSSLKSVDATKSVALAATASKISISPDKLFYTPGSVIKFTGKVTNILGSGISGVKVGIDDPIRQMCTLSPSTNILGTFSFSFTIPSTKKGNYAYSFYYNNLKSYIVIEVTPSGGLSLINSIHKIPLGISSLASAFDLSSIIKIPTISGFPKSTLAQRQQAADKVASFMASSASNSLSSYVSNPVNDIVSVAAIGCAAGIWTGIGTIPCSALYGFIVVQAAKSAITGTLNTIVDKSSLSTTNKTYWKNAIKAGNCVVGIVSLDASSAATSVTSTGWTCASAISAVYSSPKKAVKIVATPTSTSTNQSVLGVALIVK